jgi:hypothetical protein
VCSLWIVVTSISEDLVRINESLSHNPPSRGPLPSGDSSRSVGRLQPAVTIDHFSAQAEQRDKRALMPWIERSGSSAPSVDADELRAARAGSWGNAQLPLPESSGD